MKSGVSMTKDRLRDVLTSFKRIDRVGVYVGIPAEKTDRTSEEMTNAALGYIHETGAPEASIPARPFLIPGVRNAKAAIAKYLHQGAQALLKGNAALADRAMHAAGLTAANAVRQRITSGPFEPLAPSTLRARRRRGRTGTKPLIDTGQLRRAITYVIRKAK